MLVTEPRNAMKKAIKIYPPPAEELSVEQIYRGIHIPPENSWDPSLPYVAINMVSSVDGAVSVDGTAGSIGGPADRRVMRNLRAAFDAVLRGAGTLRADRVSLGVPDDLVQCRLSEEREAQPLELIIASDSTKLPLDAHLLDITPGRVAVIVPSHSAPSPHEDIFTIYSPTTSNGAVDIMAALKLLKSEYGVHSLLLEGGPTLNHSFLSLGIVDEQFLTVAPKLIGTIPEEFHSPMNNASSLLFSQKALQLLSVNVSGDELFLRYRLTG